MSAGGVTPVRRAAYEVLRRTFEHGAWTDRAFPASAERHALAGRERAQAQWLAYGAVARKGTTDHFASRLAGTKAKGFDPPVVAALRLGLFEVLFSDAAPHAAVGEAVELAKGGMRKGGQQRARGAAGLVNAVLRRAAAERQSLMASLSDSTPAQAVTMHSMPEWVAKLWWEELGAEAARSLMRAMNEPLESAMRVNTLRSDPAELRAAMAEAGEPVREAGSHGLLDPPEALVWDGPLGEPAITALGAGEMFAQSRGAQAVVELVDARPGDTVLDLCAGPGVKTIALAARVGPGGCVVAVEKDPGRASQIAELAERAGASHVKVVEADVAATEFEPPERRGYDRILADPPCSDLGTLASRPDARWRKDPESVDRLASVQRAILDNAIASLDPGGRLVYSTCTISTRENKAQVSDAVARQPGLSLRESFSSRPDRHGTDGLFAAALVRADG